MLGKLLFFDILSMGLCVFYLMFYGNSEAVIFLFIANILIYLGLLSMPDSFIDEMEGRK